MIAQRKNNKMQFLDTLKNLVTEQVEVPDVIPDKATPIATSFIAQTISTTPIYPNVSGDFSEIDKSIKSKFDEALAINTPPLYTELNDTVNMLAEDIPNVASRYKAAIKILTKRGATPTAIIAAFDSCIQIIEKKAQEFQTAAQKKIEEKIGGRKSSIQNIDNNISETKNQINNLNSQIATLQTQITTLTSNRDQLSNEIVKEEESIKLKQNRLEVVYKNLHDDFNNKKQSLLDYIK